MEWQFAYLASEFSNSSRDEINSQLPKYQLPNREQYRLALGRWELDRELSKFFDMS